MISIVNLKMLVARLEQMACCDELSRCERDHLSWALAHLREAGLESEEGTGRSVVRLQEDLWEQQRQVAQQALSRAWAAVGAFPDELNPAAQEKGVAA